MRDKVIAMFVGGAIGDALGAPIETWVPDKVAEVHGGPITHYVPAIGHKWFKEDEFPVGSTTDDTQLTLATAKGLIAGDKEHDVNFDAYMDAIAQEHCAAMTASTAGWGGSTKEAIRRLQNNVHWSESGKTNNPHRGTGNGVPMKIAPLGAWFASPVGKNYDMLGPGPSHAQFCVNYSAMTHYSKMSALAGLLMAYTINYCLSDDFTAGDLPTLWIDILNFSQIGACDISHLNDNEDDLLIEFRALQGHTLSHNGRIFTEITDSLFSGGSCYVLHSLPFTFARFLKEQSFQGLLDIVNAGGDTDTNGSMYGQLVGALHGTEIFPDWAIEGLVGYDEIVETAETFCDTFGIE